MLFFIFILTLFIASIIPGAAFKSNIQKSVETFSREGTYPVFGVPWRKIVLDNYTDPILFNTAFSVDSTKPFESMLLNMRYADSEDSFNQVLNLKKLTDENVAPNVKYERYWHGYLVYLRPLLVLFSYDTIRIINLIFLYGGFFWFFFLSWNQLGKKAAIAFLCSFIAVDFFFIWKSLQFSGVFWIAIYSSIFLLNTAKKKYNPNILFFVVGALTSFIDLLTAPLITLGMVLVVYKLLYKISVKDILVFCLLWSAGYLSLWFTKWILVDVYISQGAIKTSFDQIVNRTITQPDPDFSHIQTIKLNIFQLIGYDKTNKIFVLLGGIISGIFLLKYVSFNKKKLQRIIPYIVIGSLPYVWYLVAANHSYLHVWYTYRIQFISVVCLFLIFSEFVDWEKVKKVYRRLR